MATTLQDIARTVNLSESLVRGVLKKKANVWASPENRRRIEEAARDLNYRPNAAAQALATGSSKTVSFTYLRPPDINFRETTSSLTESDVPLTEDGVPLDVNFRKVTGNLIEGCAERLSTIDFTLALHVYDSQAILLNTLKSLALSHSCDAFVLWGAETDTEEPGRLLESLNVPFVVKGYFDESHPHWLQIDFDHEQMMHDAVDLLASLGHRQIAYMGSSYPGKWEEHFLKGYRDAILRVFGRAADGVLISQTTDTLSEYEASITRWLRLPPEQCPTAVLVTTQVRAWRAIEIALARVGRRAGRGPGEILIVGQSELSDTQSPLMQGQGYIFEEASMVRLGEMIAVKLINPLVLHEQPEARIIRLLPKLKLTDDRETAAYHAAVSQWERQNRVS